MPKPAQLHTESSELTVRFRSSQHISGRGFLLSYSTDNHKGSIISKWEHRNTHNPIKHSVWIGCLLSCCSGIIFVVCRLINPPFNKSNLFYKENHRNVKKFCIGLCLCVCVSRRVTGSKSVILLSHSRPVVLVVVVVELASRFLLHFYTHCMSSSAFLHRAANMLGQRQPFPGFKVQVRACVNVYVWSGYNGMKSHLDTLLSPPSLRPPTSVSDKLIIYQILEIDWHTIFDMQVFPKALSFCYL